MKQTAMQQLLNQLKEERATLSMPIEWDRCYQAIEMVIQNHYIEIEKEQIKDAWDEGVISATYGKAINFEQYYNETNGGNK